MESTSLTALATLQLDRARAAPAGRAAATVPGTRATLRQTVLALLAGQELAEHDSPGDATLHVLRGRVRLAAGNERWEGAAGELAVIPPHRHSLAALEDSVVLLTVSRPE
ncbi:MAG TPA: cupin domain-containing protein [Mycobacteriales bacterium]|nr:cupin domain-containing protein [Mycobacteriales bacterium]